MRLIDADALIEDLHNYAFLEGDDRAIIYNIIQKQPTADGWISVEDKKPASIETVLFIGKGRYGEWFDTKKGYFDGVFWYADGEGSIYNSTSVTHWMPRPKPPKEATSLH